jgi:threonine dehydratase
MNQNLSDSVASAVEAVASNPKVAAVASASLTTMGAASVLSQIQTVLGIVSLAIGCGIGLYVLRINAIKYKIYQSMLDKGESLKE